jgi:Domain of unknown function (DUF4158)
LIVDGLKTLNQPVGLGLIQLDPNLRAISYPRSTTTAWSERPLLRLYPTISQPARLIYGFVFAICIGVGRHFQPFGFTGWVGLCDLGAVIQPDFPTASKQAPPLAERAPLRGSRRECGPLRAVPRATRAACEAWQSGLKSVLSARDLAVAFTPTPDELQLARRSAKGPVAQLGFLVLLKLFQRLGRPVLVADAPRSLVEHVARVAGIVAASLRLEGYDRSGTLGATWR